MTIRRYWQLITQSNTATGEEIATLLVNVNRGFILREIKTEDDKIHFLLEEREDKQNAK